jgi:hypothetical protein
MLSGRGLCDELIICPEESYRLWRVVVCDLETSWMRKRWPTEGMTRQKQNKKRLIHSLRFNGHWTVLCGMLLRVTWRDGERHLALRVSGGRMPVYSQKWKWFITPKFLDTFTENKEHESYSWFYYTDIAKKKITEQTLVLCCVKLRPPDFLHKQFFTCCITHCYFLLYIFVSSVFYIHECGSLWPWHGASSGYGWRNGLQYGG